jgi:phosphoribosylformylglycinamidine synthase
MTDTTIDRKYTDLNYSKDKISTYLEQVFQLEAVACKDWLTNKVDRCGW